MEDSKTHTSFFDPDHFDIQVGEEHDCPYLPDRKARERAFYCERLPILLYHSLMDRGWRRSGKVIYRPACSGCQQCQPIRVPVADFEFNRTQRKLLRRNSDLEVLVKPCEPTEEKFQLFVEYQQARHSGDMCTDWESFNRFLYDSPTRSIEFEFRLNGQLQGCAIADYDAEFLSAVYTYFKADDPKRAYGTWMILWSIQWAKANGLNHYYLGYYIEDCSKMNYKMCFRPCEITNGDGSWTTLPKE